MIRDLDFTDEAIKGFIEADAVGRNEYLNTFISALNSVNGSTYIAIDADWGSGKTVFVKEMEYLNCCPLDTLNAPGIDPLLIKEFQDKYVAFYYNAWANDFHDDPLQSLLFSLIDTLYSKNREREEKVEKLKSQVVTSALKES